MLAPSCRNELHASSWDNKHQEVREGGDRQREREKEREIGPRMWLSDGVQISQSRSSSLLLHATCTEYVLRCTCSVMKRKKNELSDPVHSLPSLLNTPQTADLGTQKSNYPRKPKSKHKQTQTHENTQRYCLRAKTKVKE